MRRFIAVALLISLMGCAGVGLVATSDPIKKLMQAEYLMQEDRALLAELTVKDAIKIFNENNDELGLADAYHTFGNLYKHPSYHGRWKPHFEKAGTYDGSYMKSIYNYEKAMKLFKKHNIGNGVTKCLVGIGNVYGIKGDTKKECEYYDKALDYYWQSKKEGTFGIEPVINNPNYNNLGDLIESFKEGHCKKNT